MAPYPFASFCPCPEVRAARGCSQREVNSPISIVGAESSFLKVPREWGTGLCSVWDVCSAYLPLSAPPPQLPVPIAVFFLLYKERMVPCFNSSSHPLLSADELAMETRPTVKDDLATSVQRPHAAGGELEAPLLTGLGEGW